MSSKNGQLYDSELQQKLYVIVNKIAEAELLWTDEAVRQLQTLFKELCLEVIGQTENVNAAMHNMAVDVVAEKIKVGRNQLREAQRERLRSILNG